MHIMQRRKFTEVLGTGGLLASFSQAQNKSPDAVKVGVVTQPPRVVATCRRQDRNLFELLAACCWAGLYGPPPHLLAAHGTVLAGPFRIDFRWNTRTTRLLSARIPKNRGISVWGTLAILAASDT